MIFLFQQHAKCKGTLGWGHFGSPVFTASEGKRRVEFRQSVALFLQKLYYYYSSFRRLMSTDRRLWLAEEDQQIVRLVSKYGTKKWPLISQKLCAETEFERTGKQCRERWYNHLNPEINNSFWSPTDERRLFEAHKLHGNKWKAISKEFVGRTDNSIKNHFYSTIRRCLRRINKFQGEKNSTLKMRNIKPYVLSKILADRNLTETILEMGKIKPNKSRREYNPQYFHEFNQMIEKLYEINKEYEFVKAQKKSSNSLPRDPQLSEEEEQREMEEEPSSPSESPKKDGLRPSQQKIEVQEYSKGDKSGQELSPRKKNKKPKKRMSIPPPSLPQQILFREQPLSRMLESTSTRRYRRPINYMKLNEGILCESERPEVDDTNYESDLSKKRLEHPSHDPFSIEEHPERQRLQEIEEQEQKSNQKEKDNLKHLFSHDFMELKPMGSYHIFNPSPSFKHHSHFDELIVIGTHLRLHASQNYLAEQNEACEKARKQSEEQFIEEILEINFDPKEAFSFKEEAEEGEE